MYRGKRLLSLEKNTKTTLMRTQYNNEGNIKVLKEDFTNPLQRDKKSPVDAEFNSLLNHISYIERIDFLKMEENIKTTVSTLDTNEGSTKTIKYEFTEPLERDENKTSRCRI